MKPGVCGPGFTPHDRVALLGQRRDGRKRRGRAEAQAQCTDLASSRSLEFHRPTPLRGDWILGPQIERRMAQRRNCDRARLQYGPGVVSNYDSDRCGLRVA